MYHIDENLINNMNILSLEVVMSHQATIRYFDDFIKNHAADNMVYLNVFKLFKIYMKKLHQLYLRAEEISVNGQLDFENHNDMELGVL